MSNTVVLQTRIDAQDKARAEEILHDLGLDFTSAVRMFVKQIINQETIPFQLEKSDPFLSAQNQEVLHTAIMEAQRGDFVKSFSAGKWELMSEQLEEESYVGR